MSCKICKEPLDRHQACDMYSCLMELNNVVTDAIKQIGTIEEQQFRKNIRNLLEDNK